MDVQHTPVVLLEKMNFDKSSEAKIQEKTFDVSEADEFSEEIRGSSSGNSKKRVSFHTHSSIRYFTEHSSILHSEELNDDTSCAETFDIPSPDVPILDPEIDSEAKQSLCPKDVVIPLEKLPAGMLNQVHGDDHHFENLTKCPNPQGGALEAPPSNDEERELAEREDDSKLKCQTVAKPISSNLFPLRDLRVCLRRLPNDMLDMRRKKMPNNGLHIQRKKMPNNMLDIRRKKMLNNVLEIHRKKMLNNVLDIHQNKMPNNALNIHQNKNNSTSSKDCSDVCLEFTKENTSTTVECVAKESSFSNEKLLKKVKSVKCQSHQNKNNSTSSKDCSNPDVSFELTKENSSTTVDRVPKVSSFSDEKLLEKEPFVLLERLNLVVPSQWEEGTNNLETSNGISTPTGNLELPRSANKKKRRRSDFPEGSRKIKKRKKTHQAETVVGKKNSNQNGTVSDDIHFSPSKMMSVVPSPSRGNFELNYSPLSEQARNGFSNSVPPTNNGHFPYFFQNSSKVDHVSSRISSSDSSSEDDMPLSLVSKCVQKTTPVKKTSKKLMKNTTQVVTQFTDFNVLCMPEIIHSNSLNFLSDLQKGSAIKNIKARKKMVFSKAAESLSKVNNKKCKKPRPEKRNGNYFIKMNGISELMTISSQKVGPQVTDGHLSSSLKRIQLEHSYGLPCDKENAAKNKTSSVFLQKKKKEKKCSCCQNGKKNSIQTLHALLNSYLQSFFIQFDKLSKKKNNLGKRDEALLRRKENVYKLILDEVHDHLKSTCRRAKKSSKKYKAQENKVQLFTEDNFVSSGSSQNREFSKEAQVNEDIKVEKEDEELFALNTEDNFVSKESSQNREISKEGKYRLGFLTQNKSLRLYHKCVAAERMFLSKYKMGKKQERKLKKFFQTLKANSLSTS